LEQSRPKPTFLYLAIVGGILAVSTAAIFIRYAQQEAPSLVIAALRLSLASIILAPIAWMRHRAELRALTRATLALGLLSGFFLALHFATWISSLEFTSVASSVVLVSTTPLWVAIFSPIFLREIPTRFTLLGLALALLGGTVVGLSSWQAGPPEALFSEMTSGPAFWGNFLALAGAWMGAGYLMIGRRLREKMSLVPYIFVVYGMAAVVLVLIMLAFGQSPLGYSPQFYLWMFLLALVPQLLGHSTFNWALRYLPASFVAVTLLGEPIGSTILALLILQEIPSALELAGGVLILAGIYVASLTRK
jgi:drug/metabolite transporter (DMT)-like permease